MVLQSPNAATLPNYSHRVGDNVWRLAIHAQNNACLKITEIPKPAPTTKEIRTDDDVRVILNIEFRGDGTLGTINVIRLGPFPEFNRLVLDAARKIRFQPKQINGRGVTIRREIAYRFRANLSDWSTSVYSGVCLTSEELTESEETALKATAKNFVSRMLETHDIRPLMNERWFVSNFVPRSAEWEFIAPSIMAELTSSEKRQIFAVFANFMYVTTVAGHSEPTSLRCYDESPECKSKTRASMQRVFSPESLVFFDKMESGNWRFSNQNEVRAALPKLEAMYDESSRAISAKRLVQTREFQYWYTLFEDDWHSNFLIKAGTSEENLVGEDGRSIISKGEKVYGVETPLMIRIDFVKRGNQFKIFDISPGDGD